MSRRIGRVLTNSNQAGAGKGAGGFRNDLTLLFAFLTHFSTLLSPGGNGVHDIK